MKRLALVALLLVATSCSSSSLHIIPAGDLPEELYGTAEPSPIPPRDVSVIVYFVQVDKKDRPVRLAAVRREAHTQLRVEEFAMQQLLAGRIQREFLAGLRTAIPQGTELLGITVKHGIANVNLSAQFESAAASLLHEYRIAQVVWTLAELPSIDAVRFRIHGVPQPVIDQDGIPHDTVGPGRYSRFAPTSKEAPGTTSVAP